jgi:hypothetical protein
MLQILQSGMYVKINQLKRSPSGGGRCLSRSIHPGIPSLHISGRPAGEKPTHGREGAARLFILGIFHSL